MAVRENWPRVTSTTGGTGSLALTSISGYPTFQEAFGSSGTYSVEYAIRASGVRESGIGTFNGSTNVLERTTVARSWVSGVGYGASAVTLPTSGVIIVCAPTAESILTVDTVFEIEDIENLQETLDLKAGVSHNHVFPDDLEIEGDPEVAGVVLTPDGWAVPASSGISTLVAATDVDDTDIASGMFLVVDSDDETHIYRKPTLADFDAATTVTGSNDDTLMKVAGVWSNRTPLQARTTYGVNEVRWAIPTFNPSNGTITVVLEAGFAGTIDTFTHKMTSGTVSINVQIGGVNVTGLTSISPGAKATSTATANNTLSSTSEVTLVFSGASSPVGFTGVLKCSRT
jgi:hypothetical protein